jgi:hypothetical protein
MRRLARPGSYLPSLNPGIRVHSSSRSQQPSATVIKLSVEVPVGVPVKFQEWAANTSPSLQAVSAAAVEV